MSKSNASNGRIEVNEDVMIGKPVIKSTRIPVEQVLCKLSQEISVEDLLNDYPNLSREDVDAALKCATNYTHREGN